MHLRRIPFAGLTTRRTLGEGAFGAVDAAWWAGGQTLVAVKRNGVLCSDRAAIENETRLLEVLLRNPHGNIIRCLGVCVDAPDGALRLVMECCDGGSVADAILRPAQRDEVSGHVPCSDAWSKPAATLLFSNRFSGYSGYRVVRV